MKFRGDPSVDPQEFIFKVMRDKSEFKLVLIDEPSADEFWFDFFDKLKMCGQKCITIISTHNLDILERCVDDIYIIRNGSIHSNMKKEDFFTTQEEYIQNLKNFGF